MLHLIPSPLHRLALPIAHRVRHNWRKFRRVPLIGCGVIISDLQGSILLLKHSYGPDVWALPGGGVAKGEDPELAAKREIREELDIKLERLTLVKELDEVLSGSPHKTYLYAATTDQYPRIDKREVIEAKFFPRHSLPEPQGSYTKARLEEWRATMKGGQ